MSSSKKAVSYTRIDKILLDPYGCTVVAPGKIIIPFVEQDEHTAVILYIGQSNNANHAEQLYQAEYDPADPAEAPVINFFNGLCLVASSPLLGSSGKKGEVATEVGNRLVKSGAYKKVVIISSAVECTRIAQWQKGGDHQEPPKPVAEMFACRDMNYNDMLMQVLDQTPYKITHVIWHQGESDIGYRTSTDNYMKSFYSLAASLREKNVQAPIFACVASRVLMPAEEPWLPDNPVVRAQLALPDRRRGIYAGVNTDELITLEDRLDGVHFNASGQEKYIQALVNIISNF